jgi:lipopolysaccharide transport system ATP-binding protein
VRIVSKGEVTADVDIDQDVHVEIEYWNLRPGSNVAVSVHLLDGLGAPVLATGTASERRPAGLFRAVCTLPGNFLNNGRYSINAIVLTDVTRFEAQVNSVLSFTVHDTGVTRGEYLGVIIGVVRPTLPWKTEYRGSLDSLAPTERVSNQ